MGNKPAQFRHIRSTSAAGALLLGGTLLLIPLPARAQTAQPTVEQLQKEIRRRDALIENLIRRVNRLEHQVDKEMAATRSASQRPASTRATPVRRAASRPATPPPAHAETAAATGEAPAPATAASAPAATATASSRPESSAPSAPGSFKVDVQAAQRALERTLTASGALLVPYGFVDLEPSVSYTRRESQSFVLFNNERNEYNAALTVRVGLPWETQLTLGLPWVGAQQQIVNNFVSPVQQVSSGFGSGIGDLTIGLSKTLMHQNGGWRPDLIAGISYEAPTGPVSANGIPLSGSGQNKLGFSLTALKRQDPLAFVLSVGYVKAFEHEGLDPGNQFAISTGAYLATSPQTTLSAVLQQSFVQAPTINGVTIDGANSVQSVLYLGASSILGKGVLLNLQLGIGLTRSAPRYSVMVSFPVRFAW